MGKRLTMILASLLLCVGAALAQTKVTGIVLSQDDGQPVVGVSVFVVGTSAGTVTGSDGRFALTVPQGKSMLRFTYVGMEPLEVSARPNMRIMLRSDAANLDEIVVTAMGISRKSKTLGYSATQVASEQLTEGHLTDVSNALAGKVAGVSVSATSGDPGQATGIIIRGVSSINGSNQPLFVVDGVPLGTQSVNAQATSAQGMQTALAGISNINSNDIESMTVLKGAAATAIYGSRAANGVIVITTKSGKAGDGRNFTIEYNGGVQWSRVATLPEMQNKFGQGWNGNQTFIENGSWGPEMDGTTQVYGPIWNNQQLIHEFSAKESNIRDFFDTGVSTNHNISMSGVSNDKKMTYYLSYGYAHDNGIIPEDQDTYRRSTIAYRGSYEATDWLKLSSNVNFATTKTNSVGQYQGTSVIDGLYEFPRDLSLVDRKGLTNAFDTPEAWYTPYGITNPYWAIANNYNTTNAKQINGKLQADIKPINQLTLTYRFGFDYSDYDRKVGMPQIALDDANIQNDYGYGPSNMNQSGYVYSTYGRRYELNHDFMANYSDKFVGGKLDLNATVGVNINERGTTGMTGQTDDLTFYTDFWDLSNGATKTTLTESQSKRRLVGLFADVTLGWDEIVFLGLTARQDWSSTLPLNKNHYFYPGVTGSFVFSNLIKEQTRSWLDFGKLRVAYGRTGNDAGVYLTSATFAQAYANGVYGSYIARFPMSGTNAFMSSATIGSADLKPEMTTEFEAGLNMAFLGNRINLDFAFYNRTTDDQIFTLPVDPSTGFTYQVTNFGKVRNRGIELLLNTTPIRTKNFRWDLGFNFAKNSNKVISLPESLEGGRTVINQYSTGGTKDAVYLYAEAGRPIGEFYTYQNTYTPEGQIIVGEDGQPILTNDPVDTGKNINPDWTGGVTTSLSWKGLTLSAALDVRKGGYMFSRSANLMEFTGNGSITTYNDRRPFVIPNSVVANGDGTYRENTTPIYLADGSYQAWYDDAGYGEAKEAYLIDRSFVKLRNITLAYQLPKQWVKAIYLSDVQLSVYANNLFTWTHKTNTFIDPESSTDGNDLEGMFGELYANPHSRSFGFNVNVKF
ncbi:MAG: SusC/RagA family TonB-linked outer membrane protein [Prevotella sp.]|nr:SusC/RagA family TonB-linked outer membrane protein [Prevotella sp.]